MDSKPMALVTGASHGIGEQIAQQLMRDGYVVYGTSRTVTHHPDFQMVALDVTDQTSISNGINDILDESRRIDVLINNAGIIGALGAAEEISIDQAQKILDTNFWGTVRVTNAVLPTMRAQRRGTILNMSSLGGILSFPPYFAYYMASKHALEGYTASLRTELKPFGISVSILEPGLFRTGIESGLVGADNHIEAYTPLRDRMQVLGPLGLRHGDDPSIIGITVSRILKAKRTRLRYPIGKQAQFMSLALRLAPYSWVESFMNWLYVTPNWKPNLDALESGNLRSLGVRRYILLNRDWFGNVDLDKK